jgi:hypothetical protein
MSCDQEDHRDPYQNNPSPYERCTLCGEYGESMPCVAVDAHESVSDDARDGLTPFVLWPSYRRLPEAKAYVCSFCHEPMPHVNPMSDEDIERMYWDYLEPRRHTSAPATPFCEQNHAIPPPTTEE